LLKPHFYLVKKVHQSILI